MAIAVLKRTAALIFIDSPDLYDTYKTVMDTVTRRDPENAQF